MFLATMSQPLGRQCSGLGDPKNTNEYEYKRRRSTLSNAIHPKLLFLLDKKLLTFLKIIHSFSTRFLSQMTLTFRPEVTKKLFSHLLSKGKISPTTGIFLDTIGLLDQKLWVFKKIIGQKHIFRFLSGK